MDTCRWMDLVISVNAKHVAVITIEIVYDESK